MRFHEVAAGCCLLAAIAAPACAQEPDSEREVAVHVTLQRLEGDNWKTIDPRLVLHGGDAVRFRFRSNRAGYLYVVNHDAQGRNTWLYPTPETGQENNVEPRRDYVIPANDGVFQIANHPGYETTYWILSPVELKIKTTLNPDIEKLDKTPLLPRCDVNPLTSRMPCSDSKAGARQLARSAAPDWFEGGEKLQSRGLDVDNTRERSHISMSGPFAAPFIYEFRIAHQ